MWIRVKMGLTKEGMIKGLYTNVVADGGAYARMSPVTHVSDERPVHRAVQDR